MGSLKTAKIGGVTVLTSLKGFTLYYFPQHAHHVEVQRGMRGHEATARSCLHGRLVTVSEAARKPRSPFARAAFLDSASGRARRRSRRVNATEPIGG